MNSSRVLSAGVALGFLLGLVWAVAPTPAYAVWVSVDPVTGKATQFKVGGQLGAAITPTPTTFPDTTLIDPTCGAQGGTSMAIAQGSKLAAEHGVDPIAFPIVLVVSCLDNSDTTKRAQLYFLNPADGKVVKSIQTRTTISGVLVNPFAPSNGWAHLVLRPDRGDLLGCGNDGTIYRIDFSQFSASTPGTATSVARPSGLPSNCASLSWDPDEDMIYQGVSGGNNVVGVHRFQEAAAPTDLGFYNLPGCTPSGVAITGGVLVVACKTASTILRLDKSTGNILAVNGTLGVLGLAAGTNLNPGLGDLACDPVTFNPSGNDRFTDALWSRTGTNGNGAVALEFPAFTCGLPSNASVLAAGLSAPSAGQPGAIPLATCFDASGKVVDLDGDGLPDCWETSGIDFDGDGNTDLTLCVQVDTNGDGVPDATECADPTRKDLFVEVNWMVNHKPDPLALSQPATTTSVQSVRAAFAAAPVDAPNGIRIHFQVKDSPVTLNTFADPAGTPPSIKEVSELVFTPCTPPAVVINQDGSTTQNVKALGDAADFDAIKKLNFGTATERASTNSVNVLNAKRLAFRYILFAHNQTGANKGGSSASGCSELGGDDAAITLGSFTTTTASPCTSPNCTLATHNRGSADQQAGTLMHEFGHTLGLRHGGGDNINCKPNYLSVLSYTRQMSGSPITGRRLDYSRAVLPSLGLTETSLFESGSPGALCPGCDAATFATLGPLSPFFPSADQTAFGPTAWSLVGANSTTVNWSRDKTNKGVPIIETTAQSANINQGSGGCDGSGTVLKGHDDWHNLLYRASAALDFAGGVHSAPKQEHTSLTKEDATDMFLAADSDVNGVGDGQDCGTFPDGTTFLCPSNPCGTLPDGTRRLCPTHRIDIKPSAPADSTGAKTVSLGTEATVTVAIFAEADPATQFPVLGNGLWDPTVEVVTTCPQPPTSDCLTFSVESVTLLVKTNKNGQGTCSARDVADPVTGVKDGFKDMVCQFPTSGLPLGRHEGIVSGTFTDPNCTAASATCPITRAFRARQDFIVVK